jgi:hypothetical protein
MPQNILRGHKMELKEAKQNGTWSALDGVEELIIP